MACTVVLCVLSIGALPVFASGETPASTVSEPDAAVAREAKPASSSSEPDAVVDAAVIDTPAVDAPIVAQSAPATVAASAASASAPRSLTAQNLAQAKVNPTGAAPNLVSMTRLDENGITVDRSLSVAQGTERGVGEAADRAGGDKNGDGDEQGQIRPPNHFRLPPMSGRLIAQATPDSVSPLEENTRAILLKLIELEKYNLNYHLNVAKQGRWKGWRYFVTQESNNMLGGAGAIVGTAHRFSHLGNPTRLHRVTLLDGNVLSFVGQIVGASGSGVEFFVNGGHDIAARRKGYGPKTARSKVLGIRKDIDGLMADREKIINQMVSAGAEPRYIEMARAEEPVLMDIRNLSLNEFKQFHTHLRRVIAFQQSLYIGDILRNTCGAVGNRLGWAAIRFGKRHNNNGAGVMFNVSGVTTLVNPIVSRGIGKLVGDYEGWRIRECMAGVDSDSVDVTKLNADIAKLKIIANSPELEQLDLPVLRTALYANHETGVRSQIHLEEAELRAGVLTAAENVVSGTIIGCTKIGAASIFNVAGNGFVYSGKGTNQLLAAANTINLSGAIYGTLETARIQVKREVQYQKLKKKHELPGQIMKNRLAQLDEMEKQVRSK